MGDVTALVRRTRNTANILRSLKILAQNGQSRSEKLATYARLEAKKADEIGAVRLAESLRRLSTATTEEMPGLCDQALRAVERFVVETTLNKQVTIFTKAPKKFECLTFLDGVEVAFYRSERERGSDLVIIDAADFEPPLGEFDGQLIVVNCEAEEQWAGYETYGNLSPEALTLVVEGVLRPHSVEHNCLLTGLLNRRAATKELNRLQTTASRFEVSVPIALIDLDNFKSVNDMYGHHAGDYALQSFGKLAKAHLRKSDIACRWGGEEFLVALPGATLQQAKSILEELLARFKNVEIKTSAGWLRDLTFSAGLSQLGGQVVETLKECDHWLQKAKNLGRARVLSHEDASQTSIASAIVIGDRPLGTGVAQALRTTFARTRQFNSYGELTAEDLVNAHLIVFNTESFEVQMAQYLRESSNTNIPIVCIVKEHHFSDAFRSGADNVLGISVGSTEAESRIMQTCGGLKPRKARHRGRISAPLQYHDDDA